MFMLLSEQARWQPTWSVQAAWCPRSPCWWPLLYIIAVIYYVPEVAGVTFSDSDAAPVPKFLNRGPDLAILRIWESDSCSDSGHNRWYNRNLPMFLLKKWQHRLLLLPKWKSDPGSGFSQIFYSGPDRKEKPRIFPESTPALRIQSHLCYVPGLGLARVGLLWYVV